jgi:hypothetical protein
MSGITPTLGKKRGRTLRTDTGRELSHEELVYGLIQRTAVELSGAGKCGCGGVIEPSRNGVKKKRCLLCWVDKNRAESLARSGSKATRGKYTKCHTTAAKLLRGTTMAQCHRDAEKRLRERRREQGLCVQCGQEPSDNGNARGLSCKAKRKARAAKHRTT